MTCCSRQRCPGETHLFVRGSEPISPRMRKRRGGGDVAKALVALFVAFTSVFAGAPTMDALSGNSRPDRSLSFSGGALKCSQPEVLRVPQNVLRAKLKPRVVYFLREGPFDGAKGIVNIARVKEIRKLADKLMHRNEEALPFASRSHLASSPVLFRATISRSFLIRCGS